VSPPETDELTPRQRQTLNARKAFDAKFATTEERAHHFSMLGRRSAEGRLVLTVEDRAALVAAYSLLDGIVERARLNPQFTSQPPQTDEAAAVGAAS
jgi:hypothetical protein